MGGTYSTPQIPSRHFQVYADSLPAMNGQLVVITGTTSGIGFVVARTLACRGANVIMLNRPSERALATLNSIRDAADAFPGEGSVRHVDCNLQSFASVHAAADKVNQAAASSGIDVLVNNAGATHGFLRNHCLRGR
jgi:NAD(P)-dependent dehydrogenase (short-subunit alcohol dehydrogenase family)